jgi:radical SAM protein with 4Fe4S-binding SPASM domain
MINISKLYCNLSGQSDDLRYHKPGDFGPIVVYNCTARCNLRCVHCYSLSDASCAKEELTTEQAMGFLSQLPAAKAPVVLFSGGEPLLRRDLPELLTEAGRVGLRTVISTNGTLITPKLAAELAEKRLSYVGVSLDGPEPFHDAFRQVKGSFAATLKGIGNCQAAGLRTGLRFTITQANADQVPAVFDIAVETGIRRICFYHLIRSGRARELNEQALTSEWTRQVMDTIIDRTRDLVDQGLVDEVLTVGNHADGPYLLVRMQRENHPGFEAAKRLLLSNGGNRVGEKIACVSWDGTVYADQFWRNYPLGNVMQTPFAQIWSDTSNPVLHRLRRKDTFADPRCLACKWFKLCKGNYRFLGEDPSDANWHNEPACYLTDDEITILFAA